LPEDVVVCKKLENNAVSQTVLADEVKDDDIIADVGFKTIKQLEQLIKNYRTIVWNGPLGAFECKPFNVGTESLAKIVAALTKSGKLISVAGGGDVVAALGATGLIDEFSYISTAGGAFLEWLEGKGLPGIEAISKI
jgi:phosphoglycerate kinase